MFNDVSRRREFRQLYGGRVASSMYKLSVKVGPRKGQGLGKVQHLEALGSREQGCCAGFDLAREQ